MFQNACWGFNLRIVAYAIEEMHPGLRYCFLKILPGVAARDRVVGAVDVEEGERAPLQGIHPSVAEMPPFFHVLDDFRNAVFAIFGGHQMPKLIDLLAGRLCVFTKNIPERFAQSALSHERGEQWPCRGRQYFLDQTGEVHVWENTPIQQCNGLNINGLDVVALPCEPTGQHFLCHRVAIIVGQDVDFWDAHFFHHHLVQVGLVHDAVMVVFGLVRKPKPDHVRCNDVEMLCQLFPDPVPVPGGSWKPVDQ